MVLKECNGPERSKLINDIETTQLINGLERTQLPSKKLTDKWS